MATKKPEHLADKNADPITGEPGAHPVGVAVGTAAGATAGVGAAAAAGAAAGTVLGPLGTAVGAVIGGVAGALGGKAVGEAIAPTEVDEYYGSNFHARPYVAKGESYETYKPAYHFGNEVHTKYAGKTFDEVAPHLQTEWEKTHAKTTKLGWDKAQHAARDAFDRTIQLREERLNVGKERVQTGSVGVHKEVRTETKTVSVPVEREEIVIERHAVHGGKVVAGDLRAEELRIPVSEEKVHVSKEAVVTGEVTVGKRKVQDTQHVSDTVRKEEVKVDQTGKVNVKDTHTSK